MNKILVFQRKIHYFRLSLSVKVTQQIYAVHRREPKGKNPNYLHRIKYSCESDMSLYKWSVTCIYVYSNSYSMK